MVLHRAMSFSAVVAALLLTGAVSVVPVQAQTGRPIASGREMAVEVSGPFTRQRAEPVDATAAKDTAPPPSGVILPIGVSVDGLSYTDYQSATGNVDPIVSVNADVSPTQYVQVVNGLIQIYSKAGARIGLPFAFTSSFALGSVCRQQTDPSTMTVAYDSLGDRWVMAGTAATGPVVLCLVVTDGPDAGGAFTTVTGNIDSSDTPANLHLGVWTDGYYFAWDRYAGGTVFNGSYAVYHSRPAATAPRMVVVDLSLSNLPDSIGGLVPSDLDGVNPPPAGRPNTFASMVSSEAGGPADQLALLEFVVLPTETIVAELAPLPVPAFDPTSPGGPHDIRQPSPATDASALDAGTSALTGLHYRYNGAGTESLVMSHTVGNPASSALGTYRAAPRFYHLRRTSGVVDYQLFDSATQAVADATSRWAPSVALDRDFNAIMSYSAASASALPALSMGMQEGPGTALSEALVFAGSGVQLSSTGAWPSATSVVIDPQDDCTFWMTAPYYTAASQAASPVGWLTRILTLRYSQCSAPAMGTVTGTVTASHSGMGLQGVTLQFSDGSRADTGGDGVYARTLPVGRYLVTVSLPEYLPQQVSVDVSAGTPVVLNVALVFAPAAAILPRGARLTAESLSPANRTAEPGETVTMQFALANIRNGSATSNLTATLAATGGVLKPSAPQSYGELGYLGSAERPFSFLLSPGLACGEPAVATLNLTDGATNLGSVSFPVPTPTETLVGLNQTFDSVSVPQLPTSDGWSTAISVGSVPGWVTSAAAPFGGTASAFVDAPGTPSDKRLQSPSVPIASAGTRLVFHHSYAYELSYDGAVLEVSVNGQAWTDIVAAGGLFLEGGYTGLVAVGYQNPLAGRAAWTGSSGGYRSVVVQLPDAWAGKYVAFRFRSGTDEAFDDSGWFVDSVQVLAKTCSDDAGEFMTNGDFSQGVNGFTGWNKYSLPDISYMPWGVNNGVLEYSRSTGSTQGVVFQGTGVPVAARQALEATFQMRNTTNTRKRFSVLMHDGDFTDLSVCTFWMEPNVPLANYTMRMAPTKAWANATISFYAATVGNTGGGSYGLDNVSLARPVAGSPLVTDCLDPRAPQTTGTAGGELLVNGGFDGASIAPWGTFGNLQSTLQSGVFLFHKLAGAPAGVVLQNTSAPLESDDRFTLTMNLGNISQVRQRVTVLVHSRDFTDLTACTFWLPSNTALATYSLTGFTTKAWPFTTVSIYPATTTNLPGPTTLQWLMLDSVSLTKTTMATGTTCVEPQ